nr:helix-turn-helix domain-containing protein [Bacteroidales bacterium]
DGQRFSYIDPSEENFYPLPDYHGHYHLYFDKHHHLWLKDKENVTCANLTTEKFVSSIDDVLAELGVTSTISDLFVDKGGTVWVLTGGKLYNTDTKKTISLREGLNLQDLELINGESLVLFYNTGQTDVIDVDTDKHLYEGAPYEGADVERYGSTSVFYNEGDTIYQIRNGSKESILNRFILKQKTWKELLRVPYHLNNIAKRDSIMYIPSEYGYWTYNAVSEETVHHKALKLESGKMLETNLNVMCFDRQGGLWVGTERRGLLYSRPYNSPFHVYEWNEPRAQELMKLFDGKEDQVSFRGRNVNCVFKDSRGWIWVGTAQGLQCYDAVKDKLPKLYTKRDGLVNNMIHSVVEDTYHNIWVGTSCGVSCLLMKGKELNYVLSYDSYDYIPNESFVNGHAVLMENGSIVMRSLDHVIEFDPQKMKTLTRGYGFKLYPKMIRMMINGVNVGTGQEIDGKVVLEKAITRVSELNLDYEQNSISLAFSALNYFRPMQTFYRVRVLGLFDDWRVLTPWNSGGMVDRRGVLHLPLMSMNPGSYQIELQASIEPDVWDSEPYIWTVNVNEPWWRTTGVFALLGVILLLLLLANVYYYMKNNGLKVSLNSGEVGVLKRICGFAGRCEMSKVDDKLVITADEVMGAEEDPNSDLTPEFIDLMKRLMPVIKETDVSKLSMRKLSTEMNMDVQKFYNIMTTNIYKSPLLLARRLMLDRAEELLKTSNMTVGEIAEECNFASPNYFIALFFRRHRMTPEEFRRK